MFPKILRSPRQPLFICRIYYSCLLERRVMKSKVFHIVTLKDSDRWCVWESDIPGLFLETDTSKEMEASIISIAPILMRENLRLSDSDLANSEIHVLLRNREQSAQESIVSPRFLFEQETIQAAI